MSWLLWVSIASAAPYAVVLGVAQDGGHPQAGCAKACCASAIAEPLRAHHVASLGLVDPETGSRWLVEATPDLPAQLRALELAPPARRGLDGVLVTHAHIGHYLGLAHLGREVMGAKGTPMYAMPRFASFLTSNGPWDQLVRLGNVALQPLVADQPVALGPNLTATPILVPHRDEYSETVGYVFRGPDHAALWLPDIDKWERWERRLEDVLATVDVAWLDATFYAEGEIPGRSMADIPHPFVVETMDRLAGLPAEARAKVRFVHLNHTNPALDPDSDAAKAVRARGFGLAAEGDRFEL